MSSINNKIKDNNGKNKASDSESAANNDFDKDDFNCPVCKEIFVFPRIYPNCAHSVCEDCMTKMDDLDPSRTAHTIVIHHCPICREPTILPWYSRPINRAIERIICNMDAYKKRKKELGERSIEIHTIPKNVSKN